MRIAVAGEPEGAEALARSLADGGVDVLRLDSNAAVPPGSSAALAIPLVEFERRLGHRVAAVVLADCSDAALAAALVAAKVPLRVIAATSRLDRDADDHNSRVIAQLAEAAPSADPAAILAAVESAGDPSRSRP